MNDQQEYLTQGLELAAEKHGLSVSEQVDIIRNRPPAPVVPYVDNAPAPDVTQTLIAVAKPVSLLAFLAGGVYVVVMSAAAVVGAVMAFVAENAMVIGGGVLVLAALIGGVGSLFGSGGGNGSTSDKKEQEWEFYQKQEQGYRRKF